MNDNSEKIIIRLLGQAEQAIPEPFEYSWRQSISRARIETDLDRKVKFKAELILAGLLTVASTISFGLLLRIFDFMSRPIVGQIVH